MQSTYRVAYIEANLAQVIRVDCHLYQTIENELIYSNNFTIRIYQDQSSALQKNGVY